MTDNITYLPLSAIREHPDNPRKAWDPADLMDLAESIKAQGVLQPVVVRPLLGADDADHVRYELVFGHRRLRACAALPDYSDEGLGLRIPAIVRAMTDDEVALAQVAENLQRKDVTALEEADSLVRLHRAHGMSADAIAEKIGKSRSYVFGRLKLARATDAVRAAINEHGLAPETALEVARLTPKLQPLGLRQVRAYGEEWLSNRQAKAMIRRMLEKHCLERAAFDQTDADLTRYAAACTHCPKRAGNDPDLVAERIPADVCTDPECFDAKNRAHTAKALPLLRAQGLTVFTADEATDMKLFSGPDHSPSGYYSSDYSHLVCGFGADGQYETLNLDKAIAQLRAAGVAAEVPRPVVIANPHTGTYAYYITDMDSKKLNADWRAMVAAAKAASTPSTAARADDGGRLAADDTGLDGMADWTAPEQLMVDDDAVIAVRTAVLRRMMARERTADELRLMVLCEYDNVGVLDGHIFDLMGLSAELRKAVDGDDDLDERQWWMDRLARLSPEQLGHLVVGMALGDLLLPLHRFSKRKSASAMVAIAQTYGVDVMAVAQPDQMDGAGGVAAGGHSTAGAQIDLVDEAAT